MLKIFLAVNFIGIALSAPASKSEPARILSQIYWNDGSGNYHFEFITSDQIERNEKGVLKHPEDPKKSFISVEGTYKYPGTNGKMYRVDYKADDEGYRIQKQKNFLAGAIPKNLIGSLLG